MSREMCIKTLLFSVFLVLTYFPAKAQNNTSETPFKWRGGISVSWDTFANNYLGDGNESVHESYDFSLSERYGRYHGKLYSILPVSADVIVRLFPHLDFSTSICWFPIWGIVYDSFDATEGHSVLSNNFFIIPALRVRYSSNDRRYLYSSIGFGAGIHFNRSHSTIIGIDHFVNHNDYVLDEGSNCFSVQLEAVLLGFKYQHLFIEWGTGSKYFGLGFRLGVEYGF